MRVYITVPHALCLPDEQRPVRHCDRSAAVLAEKLSKALQKANIPVSLDKSPDFREQIDYNRWWSRWRPWRQRVDKKLFKLSQKAPEQAWLLDVHSFPQGSPGLDVEVALLTHPRGDNAPLLRLARHLQSRGVATSVVEGTWLNDIQQRAREFGLASALIEVREDMPTERYQEIATVISDFFSSHQKPIKERYLSEILLRIID